MQVYCSVLLGSFSFEAEKSELESSASELLCFDICHHFGKCGFICEPLTEGLNGPLVVIRVKRVNHKKSICFLARFVNFKEGAKLTYDRLRFFFSPLL